MKRNGILWTYGEENKHYGLLDGHVVIIISADALSYEFLGYKRSVLRLYHPELKKNEAFMKQLDYAREKALAEVDSFCSKWVRHRLA